MPGQSIRGAPMSTAPGAAKQAASTDRIASVVVGHSAALTREVDKLKRYAQCDAGVLIVGETGTGKEVFAQAIHYVSPRASGPMVAVNCGAVPAELMEAELFGHVRGAYTNAHAARAGLISEAEHGTLFLDDVDCLTLPAQAKLLRFLEEREYRVVGSNSVQHADVRIVAASNRDLGEMACRSAFRQDLYYRLNVLALCLPPLRERAEDIPPLARHFLKQFASRYGRPCCTLSSSALDRLLAHNWPGNVRELGHVLERATLLASSQLLEAEDIDLPAPATPLACPQDFQSQKTRLVQKFERSYVEGLLRSTHGNIAEAARQAGKNRRAFFELIRKYQIPAALYRVEP